MNEPVIFPRLAGLQEAARLSGVPVSRLRCWEKQGAVRSVHCGRRILINLDSLAAFLNGSTQQNFERQPGGVRRVDV